MLVVHMLIMVENSIYSKVDLQLEHFLLEIGMNLM